MPNIMHPPLPIYLSGMMGTGKSTIGKILARRLKLPFIDLDREIEIKIGQSISNIFKYRGEDFFRNLETEILLKKSKTAAIISLGGGAVLKFQNRKILARGTWINLNTTANIIFRRIGKSRKRPKLGSEVTLDSIQKLLNERNPLYHLAPIQVKTGLWAKPAIAIKIERFLQSHTFPLIKKHRI